MITKEDRIKLIDCLEKEVKILDYLIALFSIMAIVGSFFPKTMPYLTIGNVIRSVGIGGLIGICLSCRFIISFNKELK